MPTFTKSITIDRSPAQVFAVLDDLQAAPKWMPSIKRIDVLTPGMAMGVGFRWREKRRIFGIIPMSVVLAIVQHHRPATWGLSFNDGKVRAGATFELEAAKDGTHVTFTEEVEDLKGKPKRAERMLKMMEKQDGDILDRLKAYVESSTEGSAPPVEAKTGKAPKVAATGAKPGAKKASKKAAKKR